MHIYRYVQLGHETEKCVLCLEIFTIEVKISIYWDMLLLCSFTHFQYLNTISIFLQFTMFLPFPMFLLSHHKGILFQDEKK